MKRDAKTPAEFQKITDRYAKDSIASMRDDLAALEHARECKGETEDGKPCKRGSETRSYKLKDGTKGRQAIHNNEQAWHDEDAARRAIDEGPLSVEVRCGWYSPGSRADAEAEEYQILLGTGGPAARIIGELDRGTPTTAVFQYQDWFKPWTDARLSREDEATLLDYSQQFYFED